MLGDAGREEKIEERGREKRRRKNMEASFSELFTLLIRRNKDTVDLKMFFFPITTQEKGMLENNKTLYIICSL